MFCENTYDHVTQTCSHTLRVKGRQASNTAYEKNSLDSAWKGV